MATWLRAANGRSRRRSRAKAGTATPSAELLERDRHRGRRARAARPAPSSRRPIRRRSSCSSRATSTRTNGRSSSKPGRNDWRTHRPRADDAAAARPARTRTPGRCAAVRADRRRAGGRTLAQRRAAGEHEHARRPPPAQNGADCSSGTGTVGRARLTGSPPPRRARRCRPTCSRARGGPPRCARRAREPAAGRAARSSNCTGTRGSR